MKLRYVFLMAALLACSQAHAQQFIYPGEGQTPEQQQQDEGECYVWAKGQTGFDPVNPPQVNSTAASQQRSRGGVVRGAAVGAVVGEIVDDDAGKGAAAGAVVGGARQGRRNRQAQQQQQAEVTANQAEIDQQRDGYNRAFEACIEGRGYTIK
jgi:hypothetical protein